MQTEVSPPRLAAQNDGLVQAEPSLQINGFNYKQKMIQYPKTFFTDDIYDQSNHFYVTHLEEMLELTHSVDQQKLLSLLEEVSLHHSQMNEIKPLHNYLLHNDRKQLKLLANLLFNKFLIQFLSSTHMAVFIIFTHIVHLRIQKTREIVDKLTQIIYPKVPDCCVIYLQLLKWLREVFQSHKMAGFIQQIARDLHKVEEPLQSLYQSELGLNVCFYERESGKNLGLNLKLSKREKQEMNMQQYLRDQFRSHKLKHNIQKMFQLKQKMFKLLKNFQDMKAHYCLAIGQSLAFLGRFYEAIDQLNQACSYNQNLPRIYYQLAKCYFFTQQWGKVCSAVQKFQNDQTIENFFKSWGLAMKGRAIFQTTKLDDLQKTFDQQITKAGLQKAYEYCSEAVKYDQRNFVAIETLALVYLQFRNIQEAINILEYSRTEFPLKEQSQLSILLSYCYYLSEIQQSPITDMPLQYFFYGFEYKFIGKIISYYRPELQSMFQQSLLYYKEAHASHFIKMGTVARKQQKIDCAIKYYTRALQKSSRNFIAKLQMTECLKLSKNYFMALKYLKQVYEEHENIDSDQKIAILRNILLLYAKIFNKNKQLTYFSMKQSLQDAHKFVKQFENVTLKMFKITESQQFALQKINSILLKEDKTELYLNHVKIYLKHDLTHFANDMLSQLKRDIYDQIQGISPTKVEVQLILHISRIRTELEQFWEAQKQLIRFWRISINNQEEEQFLEYFEESYRLLCSILSGKVRQNKRVDFDHLRPYIKIDKINDEKTLESIGNLLVEHNQLREAVKYLHKAEKLGKDNSKSILQKLIEIYSILVVKSKQASLIQLYDQILPELLSDYEQKVTNPKQYQILISASKCLEDFGRIERYYQKLYSQSKNTPCFVQISKDLAEFYYQNERYELALQAYSRLFIQEPSRPAIQKMQRLIQKRSDKLLTEKQYLKIMHGLLSQLTDFYKLLINCRYNQYNTCLSYVNNWLPQLKKLPTTSLKQEIESKNGLIKKLSSQYSLCSLLIQSILYNLLSAAFPSNKTIQQLININLFPRIYKMLGGRKYFGKEQVKTLLVMIDQKLEQENMRIIFDIVLYRNSKMKRIEENQQILQYVKQNHGNLILEKTFLI